MTAKPDSVRTVERPDRLSWSAPCIFSDGPSYFCHVNAFSGRMNTEKPLCTEWMWLAAMSVHEPQTEKWEESTHDPCDLVQLQLFSAINLKSKSEVTLKDRTSWISSALWVIASVGSDLWKKCTVLNHLSTRFVADTVQCNDTFLLLLCGWNVSVKDAGGGMAFDPQVVYRRRLTPALNHAASILVSFFFWRRRRKYSGVFSEMKLKSWKNTAAFNVLPQCLWLTDCVRAERSWGRAGINGLFSFGPTGLHLSPHVYMSIQINTPGQASICKDCKPDKIMIQGAYQPGTAAQGFTTPIW